MDKHSFTVAESFGGLGVSITISADDRPVIWPTNVAGARLKYPRDRYAEAAAAAAREQLANVASAVNQAVIGEGCKAAAEQRNAENERTANAVTNALADAISQRDEARDKLAALKRAQRSKKARP